MALTNNFYEEIFTNEIKWIDLINKNLLNSIYCNLTLKPFYLEKKKVLEEEYNLTQNKMLQQILMIIDSILNSIELFDLQYKKMEQVNINDLLPLFLVNQMNNSLQSENSMDSSDEVDRLMIQKQIIQNKIEKYRNKQEEPKDDDYLYDDDIDDQQKTI